MQIKVDGWSATSTMYVRSKEKALSSPRKLSMDNKKKIYLDSLKLFNQLIIYTQRDMTVEASLKYELCPCLLSLFSNKDQKINKAKKADLSKVSLKALSELTCLTNTAAICDFPVHLPWTRYYIG